MNRRGFIGAILAASAAPAIVRADALMRIVPRETLVTTDITLADIQRARRLLRGFYLGLDRWTTLDRKSTRLNSSHIQKSRMPSSA